MSDDYGRMSGKRTLGDALKKFVDAGAMKGRPVGRKVANPYEAKMRAAFLCFPMMAWLTKDDALPQDIKDLPTSSKALKEHVRPDGGMYLGAFELEDDPGSTVIVYGDGLTKHEQAKQVSIAFRQRLARIAEDRASQPETPVS